MRYTTRAAVILTQILTLNITLLMEYELSF